MILIFHFPFLPRDVMLARYVGLCRRRVSVSHAGIISKRLKLEAIQRYVDMSHVTLNFDLSKIPFVHFKPGSRPILTFSGSYPRAVTDVDDIWEQPHRYPSRRKWTRPLRVLAVGYNANCRQVQSLSRR